MKGKEETGDKDLRKSFLLGDLADRLGATLKANPAIRIFGVGALEDSGPEQLSFLIHARYLSRIATCKAAAVIVPPSLEGLDFPHLVCTRPYLALAQAARLFVDVPALPRGTDKTAHVDERAQLHPDAAVGPLAHVGLASRIGKGTVVCGSAYIGSHVTIGDDCLIYPRVTVLDGTRIGDRVTIHSGTVIGSDGFGYAQDEHGHHIKIPQTGTVQIDDDVEIGANCTIDRATFGRTWIREGAKIDNLVQIAHNVVIGEHSILVSQVGISGSTKLGKHVVLAGQVGIVGHINIGDGVRVGAKSGIAHSVKSGEDMMGYPAVPHKEFLRNYANMRRLPQLREELRLLKSKVQDLEKALHGE